MDAAPADAVSAKRTAEAESADSIESDLAAIDFDEATASGELSFESEFVAAEPFDPEASAQSADLEIIETESKSTSPYWTDTESAPVLPTVDTGLTLDEIGESEAADAWLAAFEAEVAGEPARAPATTVDSDSEAPVVQGIQVESLAADDPSVQQDALLIASILAGGDTAETAPPAGAVSDQDAAAEHASGAVEGTASEGAQSETEAEPLATSDDLADAEDLLPRPLAVAEAGDEDIEVIELSEFNSAAEADAAPRESTELQEAGFEQDGFPADSSASDTPTSPAEESPEDTDDALQMLEEPRAGEADHEPKDETSIAALADSETLDAERAATVEPSKTPDAAPVSRLDIAPDLDPEGPLDLTDVDADLLDVFLEEGIDILDHSDSLLGRLRDAPQDQEMVVGLQRDLHTLKGGARMAGLHPIGDLAHVTESLLEAVAAGGRDLGPAGVEVLERAFDRLHGLVSRVGERQAIAMPVNLLACVEALLRGESLPTIADRSAAESAEVPSEPSVETVPIRPALPPIRFVPTETAMDEEGTVTRAPQEQIRIRADLLDRLVNYAGEVAIYRARLEQQLGAFRGNLGELDQTTTRLREQLRKLEIETEAQILSRYQRQQDEGDAKFDPLELDRFSTLQQLSRALSESASDIVNLQSNLEDLTRQYETLLLQQSRVSSDLQEGLMRTRMVPFDSLVPRLRRILRQTSGELGKEAQLKVEGSQGEMDRNVLDRMTAPLEHMLRNALAHGLETPEDRIDAGKATEGTIRIQVAREASEVLIRVSDDGRGLDREAIKRKAIERGLMKPDAQLGDRDLYGFILESGFSTAASVSKIAGRGVGMDVVYSEIRQLGGSLHIESERGRGTEFIIRLPFTLAVTQAVFVKQGETAYAVPITSVQGVSRIDRAELDAQLASGSPSFNYAGEDYAIHDLGLLLGQPAARASESLQVPVLLARSGDQLAAICVDAVLGSREIVVKPTGPQVSSIPGIFGATIMGDGRVVVILDVAPLVRRAAAIEYVETPQDIEDARPVPLVMVVDDSITMRKVTGRVLERHNFEVLTAKDGLDAIEKLAERVPDVMLLDIEMPRMDGYELATHMRNDARLRSVPIIMITSRTGDKHRQRAFEIGVDRYLGKPYQEADLMRNVMEILQVQRERSR
jgi:chemosensory pili system protein ChpA (sensor histidine kinase/response regulator)